MSPSSLIIKIGHWLYVNTRFGRWYFNRTLEQIATTYPLGHSAPITIDYGSYHIRIVSYSHDNYGFIIWRDNSSKCIIVDPGFFPPFNEIIQSQGFILDTILITHKHYDHCGGLKIIKVLYPNARIYSNRNENVKYTTDFIDKSIFTFIVCEEEYLDPIFVTAYFTPGHTVGHTVYTINTSNIDEIKNDLPLMVFTGDAIFMGSIGAIFECSTITNLMSLRDLVKNLLQLNIAINNIMIFPGHEYSVNSMQFLLCNCCPSSTFGRMKLNWCLEQRNWRLPTIPMSLFDELSYSPYLRIAIATKSNEKRIKFTIMNKNVLIKMYLPKIEELINEFLLSEKLIKNHINLQNSETDEEILRKMIFEDLFTDDNKVLIQCQYGSSQNIVDET